MVLPPRSLRSGACLPATLTAAAPRSQKSSIAARNSTRSYFEYQRRGVSSTGQSTQRMDSRPQLPPSSWCTHMHIATSKYPLSPNASYKPAHDHTLEDALEYYSKWGVRNMVFVQPSIYGKDNSCLLDGLREATPDHGRGVVEIDPSNYSPEQLREWHDLGVRGVRVNFVSTGRDPSPDEIAAELEAYAKAIRPLKTWELEVYMPMTMTDALIKIIPKLGVKFTIAHCGNPKLPEPFAGPVDPYSLPGFKGLIKLLEQGHTWVKICGTYRLSHDDPELRDLEPLVRELLSKAPDRMVWAGDWPHTRYEDKIDLNGFVKKCFEWTAGKNQDEIREKLFRKNAEELFDVR